MNKLYKHQQDFLDLNPNKYLLAWSTGTGKTRTAIEWSKDKGYNVLVVCPKALKENWRRELEKWNGFAVVVHKEEFKKFYRTLPRHNAIIIDEAHYFAGMKSQMSKSMIAYIKAHDIQYVLALTATPYMSKPWNIYRLAEVLGQTWDYMEFYAAFYSRVRMGQRFIPVLKKGIESKITNAIKKIGNSVALQDCADVPESVYETEYFKLTQPQEKAMRSLHDITPIVRYTKIHQIFGGTLKGDEFTESQFFTCNKIDRMHDLVKENKKVIIACKYNLEIQCLYDEFKDGEKPVFVINGAVENRDEVIQEAEKIAECVLLVNSACSEGWELKSCSLMIFYSIPWSLKDFQQLHGRIQRIDALQKCTYIYCIVSGVGSIAKKNKINIDEAVYKSMMKKEDFHMAVYAKEQS